jgi:hypothetical protein
MDPKVHYLAIAYRWLLVPTEIADFDVVLVLSSRSGSSKESTVARSEIPDTRVYHSKLPEKELRHELSDVSGCLGLLHPVSDAHAERKAAAFERLVSDAVLWRLAEETFHPVERTVILLQGPMLPKLRGRLMYRGISERVTFCALTHEPEWFRRVEAADQSYKVLLDSNRMGFSPAHPPRSLDRGTRSWVYRSASGFPLHFEVVTNMLDCSLPVRNWIAETEETLDQLVHASTSSKSDGPILPHAFTSATKEADDAKNREEEFLSFLLAIRAVNYDVSKLAKTAKHSEILKYLKVPRIILANGDYRSLADCASREVEEALYGLFKQAWALRSQEHTPGKGQAEAVLQLEQETPRISAKQARALRNEFWDGVESSVVSADRPAVRRYLQKVAEEALKAGAGRLESIRGVFVDRAFRLPPHGREVFNRLTGDELIRRIARETGVQP